MKEKIQQKSRGYEKKKSRKGIQKLENPERKHGRYSGKGRKVKDTKEIYATVDRKSQIGEKLEQ